MSVPAPATDRPTTARPASGMDRRAFMRAAGTMAALTISGRALGSSHGHAASSLSPDRMGVLVDLTRCVGCRRCEWACSDANGNPHAGLDACDDTSVFADRRAPTATEFCIVNRLEPPEGTDAKVFPKVQCMHCEYPPCVSACLVGAMQKDPTGPVTYDASKCIGCRYCMMACPFERLAYEYESRFTPRVRKCELCKHRTKDGLVPACVEICPVEALQYGRREDLLRIAHERIATRPDVYVDHVYGEREAGGTSWLYLSATPFEQIASLGFPALGHRSPAHRTESIQHGVFKWGAAPVVLAALLATLNKVTAPKGTPS